MFLLCVPDTQELSLTTLFTDNGIIPTVHLPLMKIMPKSDQLGWLEKHIAEFDYIIFTSPTVIDLCVNLMVKISPNATLFAMGEASGKRLRSIGVIQTILYPTKTSGAIALWDEVLGEFISAIPGFAHSKSLLLKGKGGSDVIQDNLRQRQIEVVECSLYLREKISQSSVLLKKYLKDSALRGIIITSTIMAEWIFECAREFNGSKYLSACVFFTLHINIAHRLYALGATNVMVAKNENYLSLVALIKEIV